MPIERTEASWHLHVSLVSYLSLVLNGLHYAVQTVPEQVDFGCQKADAEQFEAKEEPLETPATETMKKFNWVNWKKLDLTYEKKREANP